MPVGQGRRSQHLCFRYLTFTVALTRLLLLYLAFAPFTSGLRAVSPPTWHIEKRGVNRTQLLGDHLAELLLEGTFRLYSGAGDTCLNFMHIPKTAGTSIEMDGWKFHQKEGTSTPTAWGACDESLHCKQWSKCGYGAPRGPKGNCCTINGSRCSAWHIPPAWDTALAHSYDGCETFCVVRDPCARMFSQFKYENDGSCDANRFHAWAQSNLVPSSGNQFRADCHFIPQATYVYSPDHAVKYCQHMIRFENLEAEFNQLMESFQIPIVLSGHAYNYPCKMPLSIDTQRRVYETYKVDYDAFNYTIPPLAQSFD